MEGKVLQVLWRAAVKPEVHRRQQARAPRGAGKARRLPADRASPRPVPGCCRHYAPVELVHQPPCHFGVLLMMRPAAAGSVARVWGGEASMPNAGRTRRRRRRRQTVPGGRCIERIASSPRKAWARQLPAGRGARGERSHCRRGRGDQEERWKRVRRSLHDVGGRRKRCTRHFGALFLGPAGFCRSTHCS